MTGVCSIEGCGRQEACRELCERHYKRLLKTFIFRRLSTLTIQEKFDSKWKEVRGCWEWTGVLNSEGYGVLSHERQRQYAHRYSQATFNGPIPVGHDVRHACDNRKCVNPAHLSTGTRQENVQDAVDKLRHAWGSNAGGVKLEPTQVQEIRHSSDTLAALADRYGISISHACGIRKGNFWKNLPWEEPAEAA